MAEAQKSQHDLICLQSKGFNKDILPEIEKRDT